jgi:hypothetical protein
MTATDFDRRWALSGLLLALFLGALGVLAWTWTATQRSSAAFADSEVFSGNHLGAGTVDISIGDDTVRFAAVNMAAGDVATGQLDLINGGTLPLRFTLSASIDGSQLGDVLELVAWTGAATCPPAPPASAGRWWPLGAPPPEPEAGRVETPTSGRLAPGESSLLCMRAELPMSAPSSVQGQRLDLLLTVDAEHDIAASELASELEGAP